MSYIRVIPRDLFNEGDLLKCIGQLYIETAKYPHVEIFQHDDEMNAGFRIEQNPDDGSIFVSNIVIYVTGRAMAHYRPLNSREKYPLYLVSMESDIEIKVFNNDGSLTAEMIAFIEG